MILVSTSMLLLGQLGSVLPVRVANVYRLNLRLFFSPIVCAAIWWFVLVVHHVGEQRA